MSLTKAIENFLSELKGIRNASNNTIISYKRDLNQFLDFCNEQKIRNIEQISKKHIRVFIVNLNHQGNSTGTISRKLTSLRNLFNFSLRNGNLKQNPLRDIQNPKLKRGIPETLSLDSYENIVKLLEKEEGEEAIQNIAIFEILYGSALRVSELCQLNIGDVNISSSTLKVHGKGSKDRFVPLGHKAKEAVQNHLNRLSKKSNNSHLFNSPRGERIYPRFVQRTIKKYISQVSDISKKSPHVLRHSAATHMLDNGADLIGVKEILGHENLKTTQIYTHVSVERLKKTYKTSHPKS